MGSLVPSCRMSASKFKKMHQANFGLSASIPVIGVALAAEQYNGVWLIGDWKEVIAVKINYHINSDQENWRRYSC